VLFLNASTLWPLGADAWIHAQVLRHLDRTTHAAHAACVPGTADAPTPTFALLRSIPGLTLHAVDLGPERRVQSSLGPVAVVAAYARALVSLVRLAVDVRHLGIDVVYTSERPRDAFVGVLVAKLTGTHAVVHVHVGYGDWMSPLTKWAFRHADGLIAVSSFVARTLVDSGHEPGRIHVVHNAIEGQDWTPGRGRDALRAELGLADGADVVITVCRLFPSKGPALLIRAFAEVAAGDPAARLLVVGDEMVPGFKGELEAITSELGIASQVMFMGYRNDVEALMAASDVFAMPSVGEPFGLVFAEAMAMEIPVLALDSGGAPEVVVDGVTGLLSAPDDVDGLAANLGELLSDPCRRAAMGAAGRDRVLDVFTPSRMAAEVADVFRVVSDDARSDHPREGSPMASPSIHDVRSLQEALDADGYVVLRGLVSREPLAELASELTAASSASEKFDGGGSITGHLNCFPGRRARFVYDEIVASGLVDSVKAMRPHSSNAVRATMNFNLPGSVAQHYHMDGLYTEDFLICNIAVVDTDLVNGALAVLPGTNREFLPFWKYALDRTYRGETRIPMRQGDVVLRKSMLWHRGMPNRSDAPRPMMSLTFGEASAPEGDPFEIFDGEVVFFPNWYNTSRLGVLRERTFVKAPVLYSGYRFAKSLTGKRGYSSY
jgi:glycosyltransferase involved in cell wall biosynthesis